MIFLSGMISCKEASNVKPLKTHELAPFFKEVNKLDTLPKARTSISCDDIIKLEKNGMTWHYMPYKKVKKEGNNEITFNLLAIQLDCPDK